MFKNWKSTMAFFIFIGVYVYTILEGSTDPVVSTAGTIALISSVMMMFKSDITTEMLGRLIDNIKIGK
mgnify:CR=1 FL=1